MERVFDSERLMKIIKHPEVFPWVSMGLKDFDVSGLVSDPNNVLLMNEHGGFLFIKRDRQIYELHTMFDPDGRGRKAFMAAKDAAFYMFTQTDCLAVETFVPLDNPAARNLALRFGFLETRDFEIAGIKGKIYFFTLKDWARSLCQLQHH